MRYAIYRREGAFTVGIFLCMTCFILIGGIYGVSLALVPAINSLSSPPTPVGSGARAMGMAGAFVAVADDATAASWNPAGLVQLQKPEVSVVYSAERQSSRRYSYSLFLGAKDYNGKDDSSFSDLNYLSVAYPFTLARRNMVASLNYQRLYDFNRDVRIDLSDGPVKFSSEGALFALSPALALQLIDELFMGCAINVWSDKWTRRSGWKSTYQLTGSGQTIREEYRDVRGGNANIGLLYRITPKWTLGAVYKTAFNAKFDYTYSDNFKPNSSSVTWPYGRITSIRFPAVYGLGISYRASDAWTISTDVTRRDWGEFTWKNDRGQEYGLFAIIDPNGTILCAPHTDPVYSFRLGIEYLKILEKTVIPFRAGLFYDPIPSVNNPHDEYGFSLGSGVSIGDLILDFAYQYRTRSDVAGEEQGIHPDFSVYVDNKQHLFLFSAVYHF